MDFTFSFYDGAQQEPVASKKSLEFWLPLQEDPILRPNEINTLWHGDDVIESLHLVKAAFLYMNEDQEISYAADTHLNFYFVAARLKKVPYMVIMDHNTTNRKVDTQNPFYIDLFYSPNFGTIRPKYVLFQKVSLTSIPDTMVLFRQT